MATSPEVGFDTFYNKFPGQTGDVDISLDGGQTWTNVWEQTTTSVQGHVDVPIPQAAGKSGVLVRFPTLTGTVVVTNNHVVGEATRDKVYVTLSDGRILQPTRILADPDWQFTRCRFGPDGGSDHRPLIAELVLRPERP